DGGLKGKSTGGRAEQASNIARGTPEKWRTCGFDNPSGAFFEKHRSASVSREAEARGSLRTPAFRAALTGRGATPAKPGRKTRLGAIGARRRRRFEFRVGRAALVDAERALDAADHAADRGADDCADRPGDAVAFMKSIRGPARDALRLRGHRRREQCEQHANQY